MSVIVKLMINPIKPYKYAWNSVQPTTYMGWQTFPSRPVAEKKIPSKYMRRQPTLRECVRFPDPSQHSLLAHTQSLYLGEI